MRFLNLFITALLIVTSTFVNAGALTSKGTKLLLNGDFFRSAAYTLVISDAQNTTIYNKTIVNASKDQWINLEKLEPGTYTVELSDAVKVLKQTIVINKSEVILSGDEVIEFNPVIRQVGDKATVNYMNQGAEVIIRITDEQGNIQYIERLMDQPKVEKSFNLSKLTKGIYFLSVSANGKMHEQLIMI
jgi:hypothetical protein